MTEKKGTEFSRSEIIHFPGFTTDLEKRRKLEVRESEHRGITNREKAAPLAPVTKYIPGQLLGVAGHMFMSLSSHNVYFSYTN